MEKFGSRLYIFVEPIKQNNMFQVCVPHSYSWNVLIVQPGSVENSRRWASRGHCFHLANPPQGFKFDSMMDYLNLVVTTVYTSPNFEDYLPNFQMDGLE